jgi:DedD protein
MDMRGVFDEEEVEPAKATNETELTLSSTVLLGIVLGLVVLCGVCFGLGYMAGNRGTPETTTASKRTDATAPTTLQADSSLSKPSAVTQAAAAPAPAAESAPAAAPVGADPDAGPIANLPSPSPAAPQAPSPAISNPPQAQSHVRPALPTATYDGQPLPVHPQAVQPAMAPANVAMVQIAALANPADAAVLINALRRRGYATFARREPADGLIHVRIGPFSNRDLANQWRLKLLSDGYNAIVQP